MAHSKWGGIDVSADWLDAGVFPGGETTRFPYTEIGKAALRCWMDARCVEGIAMEATGGLERRVAYSLADAGYSPRILNPRRVRLFAEAIGLAKNDRLDAVVIARFAANVPGVGVQRDEVRERLTELVNLRRKLSDDIVALRNHARLLREPLARDVVAAQIELLRKQVAQLEAGITALIESDPPLQERRELMCSMIGIGPAVSAGLLAWVPELGTRSASQIAALVGVAPFDDDSGKRSGQRHIQGGRVAPRNLLYMAAMVAVRRNPLMCDFYERLLARGRKPKVALVAVMHKMLTQLNAMLRTGQRWSAQHVWTAG